MHTQSQESAVVNHFAFSCSIKVLDLLTAKRGEPRVTINSTYFIFESVFFDVPRAVSQIQPLNK